jgi:MerR family transcriptional regulator, light-induced transcriptional regulator
MVSVMRLGAWEMLEKTLPWVYSSYLSHGFSPDYFPVAFAAWRSAIADRLGEGPLKELRPLYDWLEATHGEHLDAARRRVEEAPVLTEASRAQLDQLVVLLTRGDANAVIRLGEARLKTPRELIDFYLDVLCPALHHVGWLWERGELSVAHEHLASGVVNRVMAYWYFHILESTVSKGKAIVTAGPNEFHALGSAMVGDALSVDGWRVIQLGANTPPEELAILFDELEPDMLLVSVTMPFNILAAKQMIARVRERPLATRCHIMVGGRAFSTYPEIWRSTGADSYAASGRQGVEQARAVWEERHS